MQKDFDRWNIKKKKLHNIKYTDKKFKEGEIWWCSAGLNIGHEIDGKHNTFERPFYILKKCSDTMFIGVPCTTSLKTGMFAYLLKILEWEFILNFSQIRSTSSKRLLRRMVKVTDGNEINIKRKFLKYINRKPAV